MDNTMSARFGDRVYPLNFSFDVKFRMEEKYGSLNAAMELIEGEGREAFEAVRWLFVAMARDGELCRRDAGYDPLPMLEETDVTERMTPANFAGMREAVVESIRYGYETAVANSKGQFIDLGLAELEQKN